MRGRRLLIGLGVLAVAGVAALVAWDVVKLDRTIPALAPADQQVTRIVVEKSARKLTLLRPDRALRTYHNREIEEIWSLVAAGTVVEIKP